ncbi:MAG: YlxR family protein [Actinobacteria bacterium]|nr:YlxR family protein [Actinomycetota bacterium]
MVRVARAAGEAPRIDAVGPGRGAYVCPEPDCVRRATEKGGLARALGAALPPDEVARLRNTLEGAI